jgi:hypothetical protein
MAPTLRQLFQASRHNPALVTFSVDGKADYSQTPPPGFVRLQGKIFECGDYPKKKFSLNEQEADRAIATFKPVPADLEHMPTILDGKLGLLRTIWREGKSIFGAADVPEWLANTLKDTRSTVSLAWDRASKGVQGWGWVLEPAVPDAALVSEFAAFAVADPVAARVDAAAIIAGSAPQGTPPTKRQGGTPEQRSIRMPLIDHMKKTLKDRSIASAQGTVNFHDPNAPGGGGGNPFGGGGGGGAPGGQPQQGAQQSPNALAGIQAGDPVEVMQDDGTWRGGYVACGPVNSGTGPNAGQQTLKVCATAEFQAGQGGGGQQGAPGQGMQGGMGGGGQQGTEVPADKVRPVHPGHNTAPPPGQQHPGGAPPPSFALHAPGPLAPTADEAQRLATFKGDQIMSRATEAADALVSAGTIYRFGREAAIALFAQLDVDNELADAPIVSFSRADGSVVTDRVALMKELLKAVPRHALFAEGLPIQVLNGNQGNAEGENSPQAQGDAQAAKFNQEMIASMPALAHIVLPGLNKNATNGHNNNGNGHQS